MRKEEILENLKKYLQFLLDNGTHKIFYNDLFWCEKTIDCINAINDLQQENKQLKEKIKYVDEFCDRYMGVKLELFDMYELLNKIREILGDKENE